MIIYLEHGENTYLFRHTSGGLLDLEARLATPVAETAGAKPLCSFEYTEIDTVSRLLASPEQQTSLSATQLAALIRIARIEAYVRAGVLFKAAQWINFQLGQDSIPLVWLKAMLGPELCRALFFEFSLGSFCDTGEAARWNTTMLLDQPPEDIARAVRQWLGETPCLNTRLVGFRFRQERFEKIRNGEPQSLLNPGDIVLPLREPDNPHDPFAIALHWKDGDKMGFVKKELACHLAPLLDAGPSWMGRITAVLADWRDPNERVFVELRQMKGE